jgi:predicted TIM-barrel fold metal-dependent hydrolase
MSEPFIIDAHAHAGAMNLFFSPESSARQLLARMDRQGIGAAEHDLTVMSHSWSVSDYNPVQVLSLLRRFEGWVRRYPRGRFVLAHAGGRGNGRADAVRTRVFLAGISTETKRRILRDNALEAYRLPA